MSKHYEARLFRRNNPNSTIRDGVGTHSYDANDDGEAVARAKELHADFYQPETDLISVWQIRPGEPDRFVVIVEARNA